MHRFATLTLGIVTALIAGPLYAQANRSMLGQATIGGGTSEGGHYVEREEFTLELMLGWRLPTGKVPLTVGLALGQTMDNGSMLICEAAIGGGCVPPMPRLSYISLLAGLEAHGSAGSVGVMTGPALVVGTESGKTGDLWYNGSQLGAQLRLDVTSPAFYHLAITVSPRVVWVPNVSNATLSLRSFNFGLRLQ
jgi:hypothetical protein